MVCTPRVPDQPQDGQPLFARLRGPLHRDVPCATRTTICDASRIARLFKVWRMEAATASASAISLICSR